MNTSREIIGEIEQMAVDAIVHQPDERKAAERHFSDVAKKIVEKAMQAVDIMEIGDVCRRAVTGAAVQDYDLLAKLLTDKDFDRYRLAKAVEALASERPIDFPLPGLPSPVPGHIPSEAAAPAAAPATRAGRKDVKTAEWARNHFSFCNGLFPIRRANCEKCATEHCWINGRRFTVELSQDIHDDGAHVCCAKIRDNGEEVAKVVVRRGKAIAERVAHGAFKGYIRNLSGSGKYSSRGGFLKQAAKRAAAALSPDAELAATVARQQGDDDLAEQMENA